MAGTHRRLGARRFAQKRRIANTGCMCGRYSLTSNENALSRQFATLKPDLKFPNVEPRYNIAPSQCVIAVHVAKGEVQVGEFRWGIELPGRGRPATGARSTPGPRRP